MWDAARRFNRAAGGKWVDLALYLVSAAFALLTAATSTLSPHRAWGATAWYGYAAGAVLTAGLWWRCPRGGRIAVAVAVFASTAVLPLFIEAVQRAGGRGDRAQDEVMVIEDGGRRLAETGTPYLTRASIAALTTPDRLRGYLPYQPAMAAFGLPRALDSHAGWWSDARVWFLLVTVATLVLAFRLLLRARLGRTGSGRAAMLVRAVQVVAVVPLATLTMSTGGDDLPVLALCLLAFTVAATESGEGRVLSPGIGAGLAIGVAASLKLFAWPVAAVLAVYYLAHRDRPAAARYLACAVGLPVLTLLPALLLDRSAVVENVVAFPFGHGLMVSPAASPLPGRLIATYIPGGHTVATALLLAAVVVAAALLVRRPPRTAASACAFAGWALLAALLLLPATRFGYLVYPTVLVVWSLTLRTSPVPAPTPTASVSVAGAETALEA